MAALKERFDQEIYSVLMNIEAVLINASNGCAFELNDAVNAFTKMTWILISRRQS